MQNIPTRIAGVNISRRTATRHSASLRADDSAEFKPSHKHTSAVASGHLANLPFTEIVTADFGFTAEPNFTRASVSRTVRCLDGEVYTCIVDVRLDSPTYGHWQGVFLDQDDARSLAIPVGVACGYQVLSPHAALELGFSFDLEASRWHWLCWNDKDLDISWPEAPDHFAFHRRPSRRLRAIPDHHLPHSIARKSIFAAAPRQHVNTPSPPRQPANRPSPPRQPGKYPSPAPTERTTAITAQTQQKHLILVIGSSGQLGRDLCRRLRTLGTVVGACRKPEKGSLLPVPVFIDVSRPASLRQAIRQVRPTLIVNAASLTDLDMAETEPRLAQLVNATAPAIIADEAQRVGAALVHFCTGMVFDGSGDKPWRESDTPNPQNQYARTKLVGTEAIRASDVPHLILRAGWLYSTHGENYIRRLIDSLSYRNSMTLASDHLGAPTSTDWLASVTAQVLSQAKGALGNWLKEHGGLYHASPLGCASKVDVGDQVLATCRQHGLPIVLQSIQRKLLSELPCAAKIPANCALDPTRLGLRFGLPIPRWQDTLNEQIAAMLGTHSLALKSVA